MSSSLKLYDSRRCWKEKRSCDVSAVSATLCLETTAPRRCKKRGRESRKICFTKGLRMRFVTNSIADRRTENPRKAFMKQFIGKSRTQPSIHFEVACQKVSHLEGLETHVTLNDQIKSNLNGPCATLYHRSENSESEKTVQPVCL